MQVLVLVTTPHLSVVDLSQSGRVRPAATSRPETSAYTLPSAQNGRLDILPS